MAPEASLFSIADHQKAGREANWANMRKCHMTPIPLDVPSRDEGWLDIDRLAMVEVTSEDKDYPVESALVAGEIRGWRAADSGAQTIRLSKTESAVPHSLPLILARNVSFNFLRSAIAKPRNATLDKLA
jgi:hypothetical protein